MASQTFVTGSKTFEITDYSAVKGITNKNYIQSERFTVGGYDWVIQFYPQGSNESVSDHVSVYVKVVNATKEVRAIYSFCVFHWGYKQWSLYKKHPSSPGTFLPSGGDNLGYPTYMKRMELENSVFYLSDNTLKIKCTLFVIMPPPTSTPALKPDGNEENPKGSKISWKYGFHTTDYAPPNAPSDMYNGLPRQPTVRIFCEAIKDFSVTARNGTVVLAPTDPSDHYQHWIKDMSYGDKIKDANGFPAFALVNRVTGQALKTPAGENQQVSLVSYKPKSPKDSVNWTEVPIGSTGFRVIRIAGTPTLNMTAVAKEGGIFNDGAKIVVQRWAPDNPEQHWNIVPYNSDVPHKLISNL